MTIAEFKQILLEQGIPDDAEILIGESWPLTKVEYLSGLNEIELSTE